MGAEYGGSALRNKLQVIHEDNSGLLEAGDEFAVVRDLVEAVDGWRV